MFYERSTKKKTTSLFRWNTYCNETKSSGAWVKLFNNPFPSKPNRFKVGQRLESIDPEHQSHIGLVSVAEVRGKIIYIYLYLFYMYFNSIQ